MTKDQIAQLSDTYNNHLEIQAKAIETIDSLGDGDTLGYEKDLSYSSGYMDGLSRACHILTGKYVTEILKGGDDK